MYKCECGRKFSTKKSLRIHKAKAHPKEETSSLKLLEEGFKPKRTKNGAKFRAKNKIVIS